MDVKLQSKEMPDYYTGLGMMPDEIDQSDDFLLRADVDKDRQMVPRGEVGNRLKERRANGEGLPALMKLDALEVPFVIVCLYFLENVGSVEHHPIELNDPVRVCLHKGMHIVIAVADVPGGFGQ